MLILVLIIIVFIISIIIIIIIKKNISLTSMCNYLWKCNDCGWVADLFNFYNKNIT